MKSPEAFCSVEIEVPDGLEVRADDLLEAVLENLLSNAVDHNDSGTLHVVVDAERNGDTAVVCVSDNGPGIPEREACFEAGQQDESSAGEGLGLYLVRTLVVRYGGEVRITENEPRGTTVAVELQCAGG